jgi:hypothetical protein
VVFRWLYLMLDLGNLSCSLGLFADIRAFKRAPINVLVSFNPIALRIGEAALMNGYMLCSISA